MGIHFGTSRGNGAGSANRERTRAADALQRSEDWDAPWFVAQVSYHVPGDEASPDIRAAQQSLWADGIANEGPDTDLVKGEYRDDNGKGVHFSGKGLREYGARWAEKVAPWIEKRLK